MRCTVGGSKQGAHRGQESGTPAERSFSSAAALCTDINRAKKRWRGNVMSFRHENLKALSGVMKRL